MRLTNCPIIEPNLNKPYTYRTPKTDEKGDSIPVKDDRGEQLKDPQGNLLWEAESHDWTLFDVWLKLVGQRSVEHWVGDDLSLFFKVSNALRRRVESGKPVAEQLVEVKGETYKWMRSQLENAMKGAKEITVELASAVLAGFDGCKADEAEGEI